MRNSRFTFLALAMLSGVLLGVIAGNWPKEGIIYLSFFTGISGFLACIGFGYDLVKKRHISVVTSTLLGFFAIALITAMVNQNVQHKNRKPKHATSMETPQAKPITALRVILE